LKPEQVLASLVELAKRTGIRVRFDELDGPSSSKGGLCVVRGEPLIVLDLRSSPADQATIVAAALARFGVWAMYAPRPRKGFARNA